jgi:hypothetical protein
MEGEEPVYARTLNTVAMEFVRYKLHLVGVQELRWDKGRGIFGPKGDKATGDWRRLHKMRSFVICIRVSNQ